MRMRLTEHPMQAGWAAVIGLLLWAGGPVAAHHSGAMFDEEQTVEIQGVVKEFQYTNPHSWLIVEVTKADGSTETWGFEAEGPSTLMRAGVPKGSLPPGTEVTVTANPMKDGRPAGKWVTVEKTDGTVLNPWPGEGR